MPKPVELEARRRLEAYCDERVPPDLRDQLRLEVELRGNALTLLECRPPWHPDDSEWSGLKVARLRYDAGTGTWTLYASDSNGRWSKYDYALPSRDLATLLAEIDADPTGIFWG